MPSDTGSKAKFGKYQEYFRSLVDAAQEMDRRLMPAAVETNDFSLWRSPRRGAVLETTLNNEDKKVIELINRWRKKDSATGSETGLAMRQVYTQVRNTVPVMMELSRAL
jgi:hypothetical protein